ncbi:GGDEF domain-containing protein [Rheinheimera sp.]|uniref:GGDEF domain-containing protein n=1 Tax=Rheinheimera sp. TaxID=1869214 RepID=UPI0027B98F46|nr:GGDEF domain-containing protein [Rheinheimera sp.]
MKSFVLSFGLVLLLLTPALAATSPAALLEQAETAKVSNPSALKPLLQQLQKMPLSANEQQLYLYLQGFHAQYVGEHDKAQNLYQQALNTGDSIDVNYKVLVLLSNLMTVKQNMTAAFSYLFEAVALADKVSKADLKPVAKVTALSTYMSLKLYQETQDLSLELLAAEIRGRYRCAALFYNDYSMQELNPAKVSLERLQSSIDYCQSQDDPLTVLFGQALIARHHLYHQNYQQAQQVLQQHLSAVEKIGFVHLLGHYYVLLSRAQLALGETTTASQSLDRIFTIQHQLSSSEPMVEAYKLKAQLEEMSGRPQSALNFYKDFVEADKLYKNTLSLQQTAYHLAKNEILNKNQQIALLEKNNTLLTLQKNLIEVENSNKKLFITLLITVLVFLSYFAFRAFQNTRIYRALAENDSLVSISNRYHFTKKVSALLERSKQQQQQDAFIIFDLDWFKQVNDQYGHLTGDWILKTVVEHCRQFIRNVDTFGRIGGEEFAVFLPACSADKAALLAEILRDVIEKIDCSGSGHPIKTSASFGVTSTDLSGYELRQLFRDADIALYLSKNQGRNRVTLFESAQTKSK